MEAQRPIGEMPFVWCDFNACGWAGDGDRAFYVLGQEHLVKAGAAPGLRVFLYDIDDRPSRRRFAARLNSGVRAHMRFYIVGAMIMFTLALGGCVSVFQIEGEPAQIEFDANYDSGDDYVLFTLGHPNKPCEYDILAEESHVVDPHGLSHPIVVKPHEFDLSEKYPNVRSDIFILRSEKSRRPERLSPGKWSFVLTLIQSAHVKQTYTFSVHVSKSHYSPFTDGPSN